MRNRAVATGAAAAADTNGDSMEEDGAGADAEAAAASTVINSPGFLRAMMEVAVPLLNQFIREGAVQYPWRVTRQLLLDCSKHVVRYGGDIAAMLPLECKCQCRHLTTRSILSATLSRSLSATTGTDAGCAHKRSQGAVDHAAIAR